MTAATSPGGTAVPPGNCPTHGYHGRTYCPRCSTSAIPPSPLGQAPTAASPRPRWRWPLFRKWVVYMDVPISPRRDLIFSLGWHSSPGGGQVIFDFGWRFAR
jgi:hypothetical protein